MMTAERLKGSLLQLAMQGKLVEQQNIEGTGNELLQVVKRGTIIDSDTQENLFEIPDNWCWAQLGDFCELYTGNSISESVKKAKYMNDIDGYPYIATKDVQVGNSVDYSNGVIIPYDEEFRHAYSGSVLMCIEGGSAGRKIALIDRDVCFGNKLCMFDSTIAYNRFIYYYLQSPFFKNEFKNGITGIIGGVSMKKLKKMWIPLPPFDEQKRIVAKIEELMPFIEQYAEVSTKLNTLNITFPDMMKKSILQEAVQGKLVPQNSNDEPASELLKRITEVKKRLMEEGKIKKAKQSKVSSVEDCTFDIPESWKWVEVSDISKKITDGEHSTPKRTTSFEGYYLLSARNVHDGSIQLDNVDYVGNEEYMRISKRCNPAKGDILISCSGSIGRCAVVEDDNKYVMVRSAAMVSPIECNPKYLMYAIQSECVQSQINTLKKQTAQANLFLGAISVLRIPLPPRKEQDRIVGKIDSLLSHIDDSFNTISSLKEMGKN